MGSPTAKAAFMTRQTIDMHGTGMRYWHLACGAAGYVRFATQAVAGVHFPALPRRNA